jgi:hypothetical protein
MFLQLACGKFDTIPAGRGRSSRTILTWVKQGILQPVSGYGINGSYEYRFDRDYIYEWRFTRLLSSEVMTLIGIKKRTFEEWVHKGVLIPIEEMGSHPLWFFRQNILPLC